LWRWGEDTYHTGYRLFTLAFTKFFDCYIFHYRQGSYIPRHKDPSCGRRIYRLNIELVRASRGGEFVCSKMIFSWWRIRLFRADTSYHYVTPIEEGKRILLSFGFKLKK
jgi:hypothetical protein